MRKNIVLVPTAAIAAASLISACGGGGNARSSAAQESRSQAQNNRTLLQAQPVPLYDWSQIRQTLKDIEGAQANTIQTTSFFFNQGVQQPYLVCNSIGFPVASTTQLTNPLQVDPNHNDGNNGAVIGQMDPNGVYTGNSTGTWAICIGSDGRANPQYAEEFVHTVGGPAAWDTKTNSIVLTGAPTAKFQVGKP